MARQSINKGLPAQPEQTGFQQRQLQRQQKLREQLVRKNHMSQIDQLQQQHKEQLRWLHQEHQEQLRRLHKQHQHQLRQDEESSRRFQEQGQPFEKRCEPRADQAYEDTHFQREDDKIPKERRSQEEGRFLPHKTVQTGCDSPCHFLTKIARKKAAPLEDDRTASIFNFGKTHEASTTRNATLGEEAAANIVHTSEKPIFGALNSTTPTGAPARKTAAFTPPGSSGASPFENPRKPAADSCNIFGSWSPETPGSSLFKKPAAAVQSSTPVAPRRASAFVVSNGWYTTSEKDPYANLPYDVSGSSGKAPPRVSCERSKGKGNTNVTQETPSVLFDPSKPAKPVSAATVDPFKSSGPVNSAKPFESSNPFESSDSINPTNPTKPGNTVKSKNKWRGKKNRAKRGGYDHSSSRLGRGNPLGPHNDKQRVGGRGRGHDGVSNRSGRNAS